MSQTIDGKAKRIYDKLVKDQEHYFVNDTNTNTELDILKQFRKIYAREAIIFREVNNDNLKPYVQAYEALVCSYNQRIKYLEGGD